MYVPSIIYNNLLSENLITSDQLDLIRNTVDQQIEEAFAFAQKE